MELIVALGLIVLKVAFLIATLLLLPLPLTWLERFKRWLRNLAVGLGNAPSSTEVTAALRARLDHPSALVREHVQWALSRHEALAA